MKSSATLWRVDLRGTVVAASYSNSFSVASDIFPDVNPLGSSRSKLATRSCMSNARYFSCCHALLHEVGSKYQWRTSSVLTNFPLAPGCIIWETFSCAMCCNNRMASANHRRHIGIPSDPSTIRRKTSFLSPIDASMQGGMLEKTANDRQSHKICGNPRSLRICWSVPVCRLCSKSC